jgi:hypothetical protein
VYESVTIQQLNTPIHPIQNAFNASYFLRIYMLSNLNQHQMEEVPTHNLYEPVDKNSVVVERPNINNPEFQLHLSLSLLIYAFVDHSIPLMASTSVQ